MARTKKHSSKVTNHVTNHTTNNTTKLSKIHKEQPIDIEFEAKFLDIDKNKLIEKLKSLGAKLKQSNTLYKRSMFGLCDVKKGYVRVRDEGDKVTMTSKIYKDSKFPQEFEIIIKDDFEKGRAFLQSLNLNEKAYHETMREKWNLSLGKSPKNNCEIAFDCIPGIPMYVEVECKSHKNLTKAIKLLGLTNHKKLYGAYGKTYVEYYGMTENDINNTIPKLTFKNIKEELKTYIKKNAELLQDVSRQHLEIHSKI